MVRKLAKPARLQRQTVLVLTALAILYGNRVQAAALHADASVPIELAQTSSGSDASAGSLTPASDPSSSVPQAAPTAPVPSLPSGLSSSLGGTGTDGGNEAGKPFGHVLRVSGDSMATPADSSETRHLKQGDAVKVGDHLQTSLGGEVLIQENDGGLVALRPNTELWVESFAAEGKPTDHAALRLLAGAARAVTGWIGHLNRPGSRIVTPTATIGIRGTDHEAYVLGSELAEASHQPQGSYDKVNRGATVLSAGNQDLAINPGQVGFVGAAKPATRGLMTLLLPVLLDKVPSFYVGGQFDKEIDDYAKSADKTSNEMLQKQLAAVTAAAQPPVCDPDRVGKAWLHALDVAQERRDSNTILRLYSDDAKIKATVHDARGNTSDVDFDHATFVQSVKGSMKALKNFHQQRLTVHYTASTDLSSEGCADVVVTSSVSERGEMQGHSYRVQSVETYTLELRQGRWLGVAALTVQE